MNKKFVDLEYMRSKVEEQEQSLKVKTGVRAGSAEGYPPPYVCYGVEPDPDPVA